MPNCCESLNSYPALKDICQFGADSGLFTCDKLDIEYKYVDYTSNPPSIHTVDKNEAVSAFEILTATIKAARSSYYKNIFCEADEFTKKLRGADLLPPWFIHDKGVVKDVYDMKNKAKTETGLADMLAKYLGERVKPKEHNEPTARPDELFKRGYGNCIEMANAFYGLCVLADIECGFAIRYSNERENFHILNFVQKSGCAEASKKQYYDFTNSTDYNSDAAQRNSLIEITPVEAMLYFENEAAMTCRSCEESAVIEELGQFSKWLPHDFHFTYSLATYLESINNPDATIWLNKTAALNPFFIPAKEGPKEANPHN